MTKAIEVDDLIDAREFARLLAFRHRNSVSVARKRFPDMPSPVVDLGKGKPLLWSRTEVLTWIAAGDRGRRRRR